MTSTIARSEVTEWYPADVKPVHVGVYETDLGPAFEPLGFSYWNGEYWGNQYPRPDRAKEMSRAMGAQDKLWRGLRETAA